MFSIHMFKLKQVMSSGSSSDQSVSKITEKDRKMQPLLADGYVMKHGLLKNNFKTSKTFY